MAIYVDNAISWAQLRIRGGWRNLLTVVFSYAAIAAFSIMLFHGLAMNSSGRRYVLEVSSMMLLVIQLVMMLLLGSTSVAGAIRRDVANRQMESNRLMPLSPSQAIVGYIAGTTAQLMALCIVNLLIGAVLAIRRGLPITDWLAVNALLFLFSFSIWAAMAMAAFVSRGFFGVLFGICASVTFSGGFIFLLVPGLLAFCTPMHGRTIFQASSMSRLTTGAVVAIAAQLLFALLFIRGAARKYCDAEAQGFSLAPALAILGLWSGLSWFGMTNFLQIRPDHLARAPLDWRVMVIGALASCLIVALLPLAAVAWSSITREQHRRDGDHAPARPWVFWLCLPVCVLFTIAPLSAKLNEAVVFADNYYNNAKGRDLPVLSYGDRPSVPMIACACAIFLFQVYLWMRILYPRLRRANLLLFLIIALTWFAPLVADVIYYGVKYPNIEPRMNHFALLSPLGTMVQALDNPVKKTWTGVAAQGSIALLPAIIFTILQFRAPRAAKRSGSPAIAPPPLPSSLSIPASASIEPSSS